MVLRDPTCTVIYTRPYPLTPAYYQTVIDVELRESYLEYEHNVSIMYVKRKAPETLIINA